MRWATIESRNRTSAARTISSSGRAERRAAAMKPLLEAPFYGIVRTIGPERARRSDVQDDAPPLDGHRIGRHGRIVVLRLDRHLVGAHADLVGVEDGAAVGEVELPAVPRAAEDLP